MASPPKVGAVLFSAALINPWLGVFLHETPIDKTESPQPSLQDGWIHLSINGAPGRHTLPCGARHAARHGGDDHCTRIKEVRNDGVVEHRHDLLATPTLPTLLMDNVYAVEFTESPRSTVVCAPLIAATAQAASQWRM